MKMDLGLKRLILVILSIIGGIAGVFVILSLLNTAYGDVTIQSYGAEYAILTALPLAILVGIWLDFFMGTRMLSEGPSETAPSKPAAGPTTEE
jgi:hypothetical protein